MSTNRTRPPKPAAMPLNVDAVPAELKAIPQWCGFRWGWKPKENKWDKPPYSIATGRKCNSDELTRLSDFPKAVAAYQRGRFDGIGFRFRANDPYAGVDLDGCRNPDTGAIAPWAQRWIDRFATYTEVSPSGKGVKMFLRGTLTGRGRNRRLEAGAGVETYNKGRYFTLTGNKLPDSPSTTSEAQTALDEFIAEYWPGKKTTTPSRSPSHNGHDNVLDRARKYLAKVPPAISGQAGHNATFHAACILVQGFALSVEQAKTLLLEWNATCQPPWSDAELDHKLEDAARADGPRGELLNGDRQPGPPWEHNGQHYAHRHGHDSDRFPLTDTGLAERFALQHGEAVRYCHLWGKYLCWDGTRWKIDDQGAVDQLAKQTARSILREAADEPGDDRRKALTKFAAAAESVSKRDAMLKLARSEPPIPITPETLDRDPWIFNCPNGKIDLRTGHRYDHRREDYISKVCPVEYHPAAVCPQWLAALDKIFANDSEVIGYLQRFTGYSLTGDVSEQVLNIWHGVGANGKSTVANTIMEMLGSDYAMKAAADLLLAKWDNDHPTALTDLHGKRFVACIETDDGRRLAESLVKELTGGDPIRARRMREDFWEFMPTHKVVLACNHRPTVRGTDHAIWRRLKLVPFNVVIPPHERDKSLPAKLRAELPGILAWAVCGCLDWQRHGLGEPRAVIEATADYQSAEDTLRNFMQECCAIGPDNRVKAADLLDAYREWSGERHTTVRKLTAMLAEIGGIERYKNSGVWYRGVGLLDNGTTGQREDFTP
jgi:putative DNA primase/helicase